MALVNTVVSVEPTTRADLEHASMPAAVMVVQYLDMIVGLVSAEGSLVPVYLHRTLDVPFPFLRAPSLNFTSNAWGTPANKLQIVSSPITGAVLDKTSVAQTPRSRSGRLPFDVSALFRGQPLPALSAEDLTFWDTVRHTEPSEALVSRTEIHLEDLTAPGVYARSVPASGLFPSASEAHIGFHTPCALPPLPRVADTPAAEVVQLAEVAQVAEARPETAAPATSAQFKWTAESGIPLMDALGISTATVGTVHAHSEAVSSVDFRWNVTSGVPLMKALGFASAPVAPGIGGGDFKWTAESGVPLMDALGISGVKLGVVHNL